MSDLEEGIIDDTPAHQVPSMAEDEEHEYQIHQVIILFMGSPTPPFPSSFLRTCILGPGCA